jgi:hypothetical protein
VDILVEFILPDQVGVSADQNIKLLDFVWWRNKAEGKNETDT